MSKVSGTMQKENNKKRQLTEVTQSKENINLKANNQKKNIADKLPERRELSKERQNNQINKQPQVQKTIQSKNQAQVQKNSQNQEEINQLREQINAKVVIGEDLFSFYGKILSNSSNLMFLGLCETTPQKLKTMIDDMFSNKKSSEEFIMRSLFLYFFEFMGVSDRETLQTYCNQAIKSQNERFLLKIFDDKFEISFEKLAFFSQEKQAILHKKHMKKILKIFFGNIVDAFPEKESFLAKIIEKICIFSRSTHRLARYSFTFYGLYTYKTLLSRYNEVSQLKDQMLQQLRNETKLKVDTTKTKKQVDVLKQSQGYILFNVQELYKNVVAKRLQDSTEFIRKMCYEFLLQLDNDEFETAIFLSKQEITEVIFSSIKDQDSSIQKIGLNLIYQSQTKIKDKNMKKLIAIQLEKNKMNFIKLAHPKSELDQTDPQIMIKCIQIIQKMVQQTPQIYNKEQMQSIINLIHYPSHQIKEEIVNLLFIITQEFDDLNSLMDIQKINPAKVKDEQVKINFHDEPNKSQKQIMKIIQIFENHVLTKSKHFEGLRGENNEIKVFDNNEVVDVVIKLSHSEELAYLIFSSLCKKTSVLFDVQSLSELLIKESENENSSKQIQEILSNLIYQSLNAIRIFKTQPSKDYQITYKKYWEYANSYLNLQNLNKLLQTFRVSDHILSSILKTTILSVPYLEKDCKENSDEIGIDIVILLLKIIGTKEIQANDKNNSSENLINYSVLALIGLQQLFPQINQELQKITYDYQDDFKMNILSKLFDNNSQLNLQALSSLKKMNIIMSSFDISSITSNEYLKGCCTIMISKLNSLITSNVSKIVDLSKSQLNDLLFASFIHLQQLVKLDAKTEYKFQLTMIEEHIDFLLDLHSKVSANEHLQVKVFEYVVEVMNLVSGDQVFSNEQGSKVGCQFTMNLSEQEKIKDFINSIILSTSVRVKCNDNIVKENFNILMKIFLRDTTILISPIGVNFLMHFGVNRDQNILKEMRKLYYQYKQRDGLIDNKRSIFYSLIFKVIESVYKCSDDKLLILKDKSQREIAVEIIEKNFNQVKGIDVSNYMKFDLCQTLVKNILNAIGILVLQNKNQVGMKLNLTYAQEQSSYIRFVDEILRFSLRDKANHTGLLVVKKFMHKNFINEAQQQRFISFYKDIVVKNKEKQLLQEQDFNLLMFCFDDISKKGQKPQKAIKQQQNESEVVADEQPEVNENQDAVQNSKDLPVNPKTNLPMKSVGLNSEQIGKKRVQADRLNQPKNDKEKDKLGKIDKVEQSKKASQQVTEAIGNKRVKKTK